MKKPNQPDVTNITQLKFITKVNQPCINPKCICGQVEDMKHIHKYKIWNEKEETIYCETYLLKSCKHIFVENSQLN